MHRLSKLLLAFSAVLCALLLFGSFVFWNPDALMARVLKDFPNDGPAHRRRLTTPLLDAMDAHDIGAGIGVVGGGIDLGVAPIEEHATDRRRQQDEKGNPSP